MWGSVSPLMTMKDLLCSRSSLRSMCLLFFQLPLTDPTFLVKGQMFTYKAVEGKSLNLVLSLA